MRDGLYRVTFQTQVGYGSGVVYLCGGRIWGGDAAIFYTGSYSNDDNGEFVADVTTGRHTADAGASVFGKDSVHIKLQGRSNGEAANLAGSALEAPGIAFRARIERIAA